MATAKLSSLSELIKFAKLIIIDKISMVSSELLYTISLRLNDATGCKYLLFGNLNVLLLGDLMQLPPVCKEIEKPMFYKEINELKFKKIFKDTFLRRTAFIGFRFRPLTINVRQKEDPIFGNALDKIRFGYLDDEIKALFDSRRYELNLSELYELACYEHGDSVIMTPKNDMVKEVNKLIVMSYNDLYVKKKLCRRIETKKEARYGQLPMVDLSLEKIGGIIKSFQKHSKKHGNGLEEDLLLSEGSRVMLRRNKDIKKGFVNGARGTVLKTNVLPIVELRKKVFVLDISSISVKFDHLNDSVNVVPYKIKFVIGSKLVVKI
uniref:ATP-dependent DNA helicase n=1 Tax=Parastrongyloides trichosuri TaxID=131310 RepID=A0A0N4ZTW6_PARTI